MAKKMQETKVVCPVCGAEFAIAEHEHATAGMAIGKDSGLGTIYLPLESKAKKKRAEELKKAGINIEAMIRVKDDKGNTIAFSQTKSGDFVFADMEDPVIKSIINGGNLYDPRIAKQHVTAQMLKMLTRKWYHFGHAEQKNGHYDLTHFHENMVRAGYDYTWDVLIDKLNAQASMFRNDDKIAFKEDNRWYDKNLAISMYQDYMNKLYSLLENAVVHRHKTRKYIKFHYATALGYSYKGVYLSEFDSLKEQVKELGMKIYQARTPMDLYLAVMRFNEKRPLLRLAKSEFKKDVDKEYIYEQCKDWQDAYKGYGAYFTMKNLILYHDCRILFPERNGSHFGTETESIEKLQEWAEQECGYWLLGALKQFLDYNRFDIASKQKEWADKKRK